jgi:hypothetical protein
LELTEVSISARNSGTWYPKPGPCGKNLLHPNPQKKTPKHFHKLISLFAPCSVHGALAIQTRKLPGSFMTAADSILSLSECYLQEADAATSVTGHEDTPGKNLNYEKKHEQEYRQHGRQESSFCCIFQTETTLWTSSQ